MARCELVFKSLADTTRQRIMQVLAKQELNVSDLVQVLGQPQSTVSRHLKVLKEADLILDRRDGTAVTYSSARVDANGDGSAGDIRGRILEWVAQQTLPRAIERRLENLVEQRRRHSDTFFEQVGRRWDQMRLDCFGPTFPFEALTTLLPADWVVADIGIGTGHLLPLLAGRFRRVIAIDPVPAMLEIAQGNPALAEADNIDFRAGDLSRLPVDDGGADLALAILVLHHVPSPLEAVKELQRIIKPGGRLLIVEQTAHGCEEFHEKMQDRWWGFEPDFLARQVERAGMVNVRHSPLDTAEPTSASVPEPPGLFVLTAAQEVDQGHLV